MTKIGQIGIVLSLVLIVSPARAIEGVEKATLNINGQDYTFPVGDVDRKTDIYYLKLALKGDEVAKEMFMKGKDEQMFYIGDDYPLWLKVKENSMEVITP